MNSVLMVSTHIGFGLGYEDAMEIAADVGSEHVGSEQELPEIPGDPLALERQVCFALSIAARSVLSIYRPILEPMGLTHPQYLVMLALWGDSPLAVKELIEMLQLDGPTLSPMLKRLEAAGLVTRTRDPNDERQLRVDLTDNGRALRQQALNVPPTVVAKLGMSLGELEELHRGLTMLNDAARRAGVKPLPSPAKDSI
jgi:MarR family transcriptional regulator, organic hydroperoxide resistance regulator